MIAVVRNSVELIAVLVGGDIFLVSALVVDENK